MICSKLNPSQSFFVYHIQSKIKFTEKELFKEKENGGSNRKRIEDFLTVFAKMIRKDPTTSKRKHSNKLKIQGEIMRTEI